VKTYSIVINDLTWLIEASNKRIALNKAFRSYYSKRKWKDKIGATQEFRVAIMRIRNEVTV
jgi:hypothetical protein